MTKADTEIEVQDRYARLKFKKVTDVNQIRIGMMIQIAENNTYPISWEWCEVDEKLLLKIGGWTRMENFKWVRLPDYA